MIAAWAGAFLLTQLVEVPIYARALDRPRRWLWAFGASALTHPIVFFVFPRVWPGTWWHQVAAAEAFAVAFEAGYLAALGVRRGVWWALLANGASLVVGQGTRALWGWP